MLLLGVLVSLGLGAWTALAQVTVPTTSCPLPGSQFQGADGNQADGSAACPPTGSPTQWIDWQGLQAAGRVVHASDPNAEDTEFAGGNTVLNPGNWGIRFSANGVSPASDNILDIYSAFDRAPGQDGFLYFAFTREDTTGTTALSFELNQDPVPRAYSNGYPLPCRVTGDLLISFIVSGSSRSVQVYRWNTATRTAPSDVHPDGCALTGTITPATGLVANQDVQGSFNTTAINNYLPLSEPSLVLAPGTSMIASGHFAETAINLTKALGSLDDGCRVFGSIWAHSRSSTTPTSQLKDYVEPEPFSFNSCKVTPTLTSETSGAVNRRARTHRLRRHQVLTRSLTNNDTAVLSGGDNPTGTMTFSLYGPNDATCTGTPADEVPMDVTRNGAYQVPSFTVTAPGIYRWRATYSGDDNNNPAGPTPCGTDTETVVVTKASPDLTTTASGPVRRSGGVRVHTGRAGGRIYDAATLSDGFNPTGTIKFKLYGPGNRRCRGKPIFTSTATVNGEGTYPSDPFTVTRAGTYRWVAIYFGDANNRKAGPTACGDPDETIKIAKARPTLTTEASGATVFDNPISDTATLTGGADPKGAIIFKVYGPDNADCSGRPARVFRVPVDRGNDVYSSGNFTPPAVGTYRWVARYTGDGFNAPAATKCGDPAEEQVVAHQVVQPSLTTTVLTSSSSPVVGVPIQDTATLSGSSQPPAPVAGGHIIFKVYGPDNTTCSRPAAAISVVAVSGNNTYTSGTFTPTEAGTYRWVAFYTGDAVNKPAKTGCGDETITVAKGQPSISTRARASVTLPGFTRDAATLNGVNPGGTIVFELFGPNNASCSAPPAFRAELNVVGNGVYRSPRFYPRAAGTYLWVVSYSGDDNNNPAATGCGESGEITDVLPHDPSLTTSASPPARLHPSASRVRSAGLEIYDSATLTGFRPTGHITFDLYGPNNDTCSGDPIFTTATTVKGNGIYNSEPFTPMVSGTYRWRATYSGDGNNNPVGPTDCRDPNEAVDVTVPADPSLITSASDAVPLGGAIHDTATLSGGSDPTGTITFKLYAPSDAPNDTACSGKPIFTSTVGVHGNGDYTSASFVPTAAGAYLWVASYSGDHTNHGASTACRDAGETGVVRPPDITPVTPGLSTTASPPALGADIFDTAHLSGGIDPSGAVTFKLFGPDDPTCSRPSVFTAVTAVSGNGDYPSASFTVLAPGTYRWVASYAGDAMNNPVDTACGDPAETITVSATVGPEEPDGPNVPTPPPPPKPKPKPPKPGPPPFTG